MEQLILMEQLKLPQHGVGFLKRKGENSYKVRRTLSLPSIGALLGVSCDSRQGPFLGDSAVLKSRRTTVKGKKATATLFYLFSTATALYFKKRERHWQSTQVSVMRLLKALNTCN